MAIEIVTFAVKGSVTTGRLVLYYELDWDRGFYSEKHLTKLKYVYTECVLL